MRKIIGPAVTALLLFLAAISLGVWQIYRLHWKEGLLADIAAAQASPPVPLRSAPRQFTKVSVGGTWDMSHAVRYGTDLRGETLGSFMVEPLLRPGQPPLFVNRGFVPDGWRLDPGPEGPITVVGYIAQPDHAHWWSIKDDPARRHFYTLNPRAIAAELGMRSPLPYLLERMGPETAYPEPAHAFPELPNNHLNYAITWFSLAAVDLVIFALWARKTLRS